MLPIIYSLFYKCIIFLLYIPLCATYENLHRQQTPKNDHSETTKIDRHTVLPVHYRIRSKHGDIIPSSYVPYGFSSDTVSEESEKKRTKRSFESPVSSQSSVIFTRKIRAATARKERLWPDGVIPYIITSNFSHENRNLFLKAMRHWENSTCITFVPRQKHDKNYIMFTVDKCGCCSYVGRRGDGPQAISIGKNCDKFGIVVHELGHVVGFWHEHTRPDRDMYVDIFYKSIQPGQDYNFEKSKPGEVNSLGEPYDFASIMHYARDTFSRGIFHDTILPKPNSGFRSEIGQRVQLSEGDIIQAKKLYNCPVCGGTMLMESAELRPTQIGYCAWRIIAPEGHTVFLNVSGRGLALPKDSCLVEQESAVIARDGRTAKDKIIEKVCGNDPIFRTVVSTENHMYVEMKVTELPSHAIASFHSVCGGPLYADQGVIQSPRYPDNYPPNSDCLWTIHVTEGQQVALKINYFHVEQHKDCIYDRLVLWEGTEEDVGEPLANLCGQFSDRNFITKASSVLTVRFFSDNSVQKSGFELEWTKELDECGTGEHFCEHICENMVGGFRCTCNIGYSLRPDGRSCESTCGGYLKASEGRISTPNYPENYPSLKNCIWEIEASSGYQIFLNFTHFNIEGMKTECAYDYVKIDDKHKLCGEYADPIIFTSETNRVRLEFVSDSSVERSGFSLSFLADLDECQYANAGCEHVCENRIGSYKCSCNNGYVLSEDGHNCKEGGCFFELNEHSGDIASPNFPQEYPKTENCTWHILTTPGHRIALAFTAFELEEHSQCNYDKLLLYDGGNATAPVLAMHCGVNLPSNSISSTNQMFILFASDSSVSRRGFHATYTSECGGVLFADTTSGYIYSHATYSDNSYPQELDCQWKIRAKHGRSVKLQFNSFNLEPDAGCQYDYVDVFDGDEIDTEKLFGRYCGDTIPTTITSTGNSLLLVLHSDNSVEEKGFVAEYRESGRGLLVPSGQVPTRNTDFDTLNREG